MKVIFRILDGEVIALFPEIGGTRDITTCMSYMHNGQHSSASLHNRWPLATAEQYAPLVAELKRVGYDELEVCTRVTPQMTERRTNPIRITMTKEQS